MIWFWLGWPAGYADFLRIFDDDSPLLAPPTPVSSSAMAVGMIERVGQRTNNMLAVWGDFAIFVARTFMWIFAGGLRPKNLRLLLPQFFEVGVKSVPVVAVTGAFIGMVMAVESITQFKAIGQEERMGSVINVSVVKQIGPVLAAVMLAGRVGGCLLYTSPSPRD